MASRDGLRLFPCCRWPRPSKALKLCLLEASHLGLARPAWAQGQGSQGFGERSLSGGTLSSSGGTRRSLVPRSGSVVSVPEVLRVPVNSRGSPRGSASHVLGCRQGRSLPDLSSRGPNPVPALPAVPGPPSLGRAWCLAPGCGDSRGGAGERGCDLAQTQRQSGPG